MEIKDEKVEKAIYKLIEDVEDLHTVEKLFNDDKDWIFLTRIIRRKECCKSTC